MNNNLVNRLKSLPALQHIPDKELQWLTRNGNLEIFQPGLIAPKGTKVEVLWIILTGRISVRIDRGAGPKVVNTELSNGSVTGMLPYSRLQQIPGDAYAEEKTEVLSLAAVHFTDMINKCPVFTAHTVHSMIDRARIHNTSAMQDEKLISIGRLAAGLSHELNNPASVAIRDARLLKEMRSSYDQASRILSKEGLNEEQFKELETIYSGCMEASARAHLTALHKMDLQDKISDWLEKHQMNTEMADQLADLAFTLEDLDKLLGTLPRKIFESALQWIIAGCSLHHLSAEIEQSANQIYQLVEAVKKFTYMDSLAEKELVDVEQGIHNALRVLDAKVKSKKAVTKLEIEKELPGVYANGAALNQVWFSLIDNALDAVPESGEILICAALRLSHIAVRIIDNGPGIPAQSMDKIFDPFYTTKPPGQGTGLGLDLSRRITRRYQGDIKVRSQAGKTEFCVDLIAANS